MNPTTDPLPALAAVQTPKHESLQAFQQRLSAKILAAQAQSSMELLRLHVRVQGRSMLLALPETNQVVEPGTLLSVPLTQPWLMGLTSVRGELTSVIDLGLWMGWGAAVATPASRWVILAASLGAPCAIAVDAVLGLVNVNAGQWQRVTNDAQQPAASMAWLHHEQAQGVAAPCWGEVYQQNNLPAQAAQAFACDFSLSKMLKLNAFLSVERR